MGYNCTPFMSIRSEEGIRNGNGNGNGIIGMDGQVVRPDVLAPACWITPSNGGPAAMVPVEEENSNVYNVSHDLIDVNDSGIRSQPFVPPSRHAMIGMDGSVVKLSDKGSSGGSRRSRRFDQPGAVAAVDSSFSSQSEGSYDDWDDQPRKLYRVPVRYNDHTKRRKRCLWAGAAMIFAFVVFLMALLLSRNAKEQRAISAAQAEAASCQPGVIIKDTFEPRLQLIITGLSEYPTHEETRALEQAISEGYNDASGGCSDEFERYMYQVSSVNQTLESHLVLTDKTTRLENIFEETSVLTTDFATKISCDGCSSEVAFATEYPASFGLLTSKTRARDPDAGYRRDLASSERNLEEPSAPVVSGSLNAGRIIDAMERRARQALDGLESFREVTILIHHADGSTASTTLHKELQQDETEYSASFFRNKVVSQAQSFRQVDDCEEESGDDDDDGGGVVEPSTPSTSPAMGDDDDGGMGPEICPADMLNRRAYIECLDDCEMGIGQTRLACQCSCCCETVDLGEDFTQCVTEICRGDCEETTVDDSAAITCVPVGKKGFGGKKCSEGSGSGGKKSGSGGKKGSSMPTFSSAPSLTPSTAPSDAPSPQPSETPSRMPSAVPSQEPSALPSQDPSLQPSAVPSQEPSSQPSEVPSLEPSAVPSQEPSSQPSEVPSLEPSAVPSQEPSSQPSEVPSQQPSLRPSEVPSQQPSEEPSQVPSQEPSQEPSQVPSQEPSEVPSSEPTVCGGDVIVVTECDQRFTTAAGFDNAVIVLGDNLVCGRGEDGIVIEADGVTLDCLNLAIRGRDIADRGILVRGMNNRVINCVVNGFDDGIRGADNDHDNLYLENVTARGNGRGGVFVGATTLTIVESAFNNNERVGLRINGGNRGNVQVMTQATITNTQINRNDDRGIVAANSAIATLINSEVNRNSGQGVNVDNDMNDSTIILQSSEACNNIGGDVEDRPFVIGSGAKCDSAVAACNCDCNTNTCAVNTIAVTTCGQQITQANADPAIDIEAEGVTLDCMGQRITGPGTADGVGVLIDMVDNVKVINCDITMFQRGIVANGDETDNAYLENINAFGNAVGFRDGGSSSTVTRSSFDSNVETGIQLIRGTSSITSTTANGNTEAGIRLRGEGLAAEARLYQVTTNSNGNGGNNRGGIIEQTNNADSGRALIAQRTEACNNVGDQGDISSGIDPAEGVATQCDDTAGTDDDRTALVGGKETQKSHRKFVQEVSEEERSSRASSDASTPVMQRDAPDVVSSLMTAMTAQEREKVYYDIHGIVDDIPEEQLSEADVALLKFQLEEELLRIGHKSEAYLEAMAQNEKYVQSLFIGFLVRDRFVVSKAAKRMLEHFDFKLELWGKNTLGRDVMQSDMDKEDMAALKRGMYQYLPRRDTAGRAIFIKIWKETEFHKEKCVWRALWYHKMAMNLDEETRLNDNNFKDCSNHTLLAGVARTLNAIPTKEAANHLCYSDKRFGLMLGVGARILDDMISCRARMHSGTHIEVKYDLLSYGIPTSVLPINDEGDMKRKDAHLANLKMLRAREELLNNGLLDPSQPTIVLPANQDVLLGRGQPVRMHPGNLRLGFLVEERQEEYESGGRHQKIDLTDQIFQSMKKNGTRFIRQNEHGIYIVVDETTAKDKIEHFFRNRKQSQPSSKGKGKKRTS
ncbi:MAG: hypothetical protein SGILL_000890 [Bacillariaceae sp.]